MAYRAPHCSFFLLMLANQIASRVPVVVCKRRIADLLLRLAIAYVLLSHITAYVFQWSPCPKKWWRGFTLLAYRKEITEQHPANMKNTIFPPKKIGKYIKQSENFTCAPTLLSRIAYLQSRDQIFCKPRRLAKYNICNRQAEKKVCDPPFTDNNWDSRLIRLASVNKKKLRRGVQYVIGSMRSDGLDRTLPWRRFPLRQAIHFCVVHISNTSNAQENDNFILKFFIFFLVIPLSLSSEEE